MTQTALILGASGKIGRHFTAAFRATGWQTRAYARGTDMNAAALGCDVIVNGMNPPMYHDWNTILPAITTQVLAAAKTSGATILFPGNVYVFGAQPGPWSEATPHRPCSRKGTIRAEVEVRYRAAAADGVQTIILRAGDFIQIEPGDTMMDVGYLRKFTKGVVTSMGDPDAARAHAFLPDMARAGVMLADRRASLPAFCDVPFAGYNFSTRDLAERLSRLSGRSLSVRGFPWWLMAVASPVWELARELKEMRYLYDTPHRMSAERLAALLPDYRDTPLDEVLAQVLAHRQPSAVAA